MKEYMSLKLLVLYLKRKRKKKQNKTAKNHIYQRDFAIRSL